MRIAPLVCAVYALHAGPHGNLQAAVEELVEAVVSSCLLTHTSVLGISPAFALGYVLLEVLHQAQGHSGARLLSQETPHQQLGVLGEMVEEFEAKLWEHPDYEPFRCGSSVTPCFPSFHFFQVG